MMRTLIGVSALAAALCLVQGCGFLAAATGLGATALVVNDRRTAGMYIEDENIEWKAIGRLRHGFEGAHVNAASFNRRVLLTGEAPNDEVRKRVEETVRSIENVKEVINELQVAGASSLASRGNDVLITSNVKARMVGNGKFSPIHVKVVTQAGVVYLLGLVSPAEGDAAVEIARTTSGVAHVVKVFEYISR